MYEGKEVNTIQDLIDNFHLDEYKDAKAKWDQEKAEAGEEDPEKAIPGIKDKDE